MVTVLNIAVPDANLVSVAKIRAARMVHDGRDTPSAQRYIQSCWHYHRPTETAIIFTRECGYHSGGWWKNPDYERCYHLSLRNLVYDNGFPVPLPFNRKSAGKWVKAFWGDDANLAWHEGPHTDVGKREGVHHYRLFCDPSWRPIMPTGEVYSKDWTPAEWRSFSELHGAST